MTAGTTEATKAPRAARKTLYLTDSEVDLLIESLSEYQPENDKEVTRVDKLEDKLQRTRERRNALDSK